MGKERLDVILVRKGFFNSRERARSAIMEGAVYVNNNREDKPGAGFDEQCAIEIKKDINPYVSRGGLKLEKALVFFNIDLNGRTAVDIGASTGGFTDCMLKNGASKVVAIDVGYGQLAWELRNNTRVTCMERTNIRYVNPADIGYLSDFATIDVSFISLKKVIVPVKSLIHENAGMLCLVKPQFEAGRKKVGKHGVVREPGTHIEVLKDIISFSYSVGLGAIGLTYSPIKGPEGNIEYLLYISGAECIPGDVKTDDLILHTVEEAHRVLI